MIPWSQLDTATIPGGGVLRLIQRGTEFAIRLGDNDLMNSRLSGSEEKLATLSCAKLADRPAPHILIGGLGMGFTLRAALAVLPAPAKVVVAELVPAVVAWAKGPMAQLFAGSLEDPRVAIVVDDVAAVLRSKRAAYDAILLDVDNGPDGLTKDGNDALYAAAGLRAAHAALRPGGILAVWSAAPDAAFGKRLVKAGFAVEEARVRASRTGGGARHVIWLAAKAGA